VLCTLTGTMPAARLRKTARRTLQDAMHTRSPAPRSYCGPGTSCRTRTTRATVTTRCSVSSGAAVNNLVLVVEGGPQRRSPSAGTSGGERSAALRSNRPRKVPRGHKSPPLQTYVMDALKAKSAPGFREDLPPGYSGHAPPRTWGSRRDVEKGLFGSFPQRDVVQGQRACCPWGPWPDHGCPAMPDKGRAVGAEPAKQATLRPAGVKSSPEKTEGNCAADLLACCLPPC